MATDVKVFDSGWDRTIGQGIDSPSDADLVRQLINGSEEALASLYDRHAHAVYAAAVRASRDRSVAAEVVQDTFLALWNRAELFDPSRGTLPAWLVTIARNRAVDRIRSAARHERAADFSSFNRPEEDDHSTVDWLMASGELIAAAGPEPGPEVALFNRETRAAVEDALASLSPMERSVIVLAYDRGLSQTEIAARLGWPIGTVKTRTRRALRHLRDRFERPYSGEPTHGVAAEWVTAESASTAQRSVPADGPGDSQPWWSAASSSKATPARRPCQGSAC
jgi:RNA polymerase sigma-70 factor (ECF subfamily)